MPTHNDAHEALCRRCGQSCHFAVPVNGLPVVVDDLHCRFLERESGGKFKCSVYQNRFKMAPWCQTVDHALREGFLAQDCPYTLKTPGYRGKTRLHPRLLAKVEPEIRNHILANGLPAGASLDGLARFLERTGGGEFEFELSHNATHIKIRQTDR